MNTVAGPTLQSGKAEEIIAPAAASPFSDVAAEFEALLKQSTNVANAKIALGKALTLIELHPVDAAFQSLLLQIRERAGDTATLLMDVEALFRTRPTDRKLLELFLRRLVKIQAKDRALEELEAVLPSTSSNVDDILDRAELLYRIQAFEEGDQAYRYALELNDTGKTRIAWAKQLAKRNLFEDAGIVLDRTDHEFSGARAQELIAEIENQRSFYRRFYSGEKLACQDFRILAMEQAILQFKTRPSIKKLPKKIKLHLITGSLGAGGAERQLCGLAQLIKAEQSNGADIAHVDVTVKEHARLGVSDFFLDGLQKSEVPVYQLNEMKPVSAAHQKKMRAELAHFMGMLPPQVHYGVVRLAPHLRATKPHVVSIWQDGACLFGALAALFAGVKSIQLVFRGLPPNIRLHRQKAEYAPLYQAMAQIPGVEFVSNSLIGAQAYAEWLDIPLERFHILYNGVAYPNCVPNPSDVASWESFAQRTADATETIGGVFRFESDKRPISWLRVAAAYLAQRPKARFVIVGDGRMIEKARELVDQLNLNDRMLFAGSSKAVGYWYDKFDVKLLMSRFEGLPNVLIEAQYLGCPVVSTPAGGAAECFDEGETGSILDCAENPDLHLACEYIRNLVDLRKHDPDSVSRRAISVAERFSAANMLDKFQSICRASVSSK